MNRDDLEAIDMRLCALEQRAAIQPAPRGTSMVAAIVADASRLFDTPIADILSASKRQEATHARFAIAWVAKRTTGYSLPRIGLALGDRDHSTIVHAIKRAEELRGKDGEFLARSNQLLAAAEERKPSAHAEPL